jgi:hypothetical protein
MLDFVFFMSAPFLSLRPELPTRGHRVDGSGVGIVLYDTDFEHRPVACRTDDHEHLAAIERADKWSIAWRMSASVTPCFLALAVILTNATLVAETTSLQPRLQWDTRRRST